jgi:hypothetical protein
MQYTADLSFKIKASTMEMQNIINKIRWLANIYHIKKLLKVQQLYV